MQIIKLSKTNQQEIILKAIAVLKKDGIIIYPTETCYGVGVDATNSEAVKKLLTYKERPTGKAISVAVSDEQMAQKYVKVNETARNLYKNFLPGPITVISNIKRSQKIATGIAAEDGSLGIRIPDYSLMVRIIKQFGKPITATSANMSGRKTPYKIADILNNIPEKKKGLIDLIIDAGELPHNPPSTVVDTRLNDEKVLREGSILFESPTNKSYKTYMSLSEEETQKIGEDLMYKLLPKLKHSCIIFALQGELGAGKTQFAKGVARALGIKETITSPTFVLVKEYPFQLRITNYELRVDGTLFHIDTWRLQDEKELEDLGFERMIKPGNVILVEWIQKARTIFDLLTKETKTLVVWLNLIQKKPDNLRQISIMHT